MRYGVIGGGGMASVHAGHILRMPDANLIACAAPEFSPAMRALADSVHAPCSADISALLRRNDIDAVVIATPTDTHAALTVAALQAGVSPFSPGRGVPSPSADVAGVGPSTGADVAEVGPVPVQMEQGRATSRCRYGRGEPS